MVFLLLSFAEYLVYGFDYRYCEIHDEVKPAGGGITLDSRSTKFVLME